MGEIYDFSKSNMILMIGRQILLILLVILIVYFGTGPLSFPANKVRELLSSKTKFKSY
jgi:hypothetical protein